MLDPAVAESLQFLHDIIHVDGSSPIPGSDTLDNQYLAGQVAMMNRGHWVIPNIRNAKLNSDVAIPPTKVNDYTVVGFGADAAPAAAAPVGTAVGAAVGAAAAGVVVGAAEAAVGFGADAGVGGAAGAACEHAARTPPADATLTTSRKRRRVTG